MGHTMDSIGDVFDPSAEVLISEHTHPHWAQAGAITFITMRLADSVPREVIQRWDRERVEFLNQKGIRCASDWRSAREKLNPQDRADFERQFNRAREDFLDTCIGNCELKHADVARTVADSLMHFDHDRYVMGDFVIMPNHVHMLVVFRVADDLQKQCGSWMRFTATKINRLLGRSGSLWYGEPFDHLVRSENQLTYLRRYIQENPMKAGIVEGQYLYRRSKHHF